MLSELPLIASRISIFLHPILPIQQCFFRPAHSLVDDSQNVAPVTTAVNCLIFGSLLEIEPVNPFQTCESL
jgi:hypothetical protein